jgi:hypothetical protein
MNTAFPITSTSCAETAISIYRAQLFVLLLLVSAAFLCLLLVYRYLTKKQPVFGCSRFLSTKQNAFKSG